MLITRIPLRISFLGGGSDFPSFYQEHEGFVIGSTIQKYIYINTNYKFDDSIRVSYSKAEIVNNVSEIKHDIARQVLTYFGIRKRFEISSMSDVPSNGTGMGSSSAYCVGLIYALSNMLDSNKLSLSAIAEKACDIEINKLQKPIGKQDQYFAAYGGLKSFTFKKNDVIVNEVKCSKETYNNLQNSLFLVYTGITRSADEVLHEQKINTESKADTQNAILKMVNLAKCLQKELENDDVSNLGFLLDEAWSIKKTYANSISNSTVDQLYSYGKANGADGGKLLGAGGGGFILFYVSEKNRQKFLTRMTNNKILPVKFSDVGCEIIFKQSDL